MRYNIVFFMVYFKVYNICIVPKLLTEEADVVLFYWVVGCGAETYKTFKDILSQKIRSKNTSHL